jgi:putative glutamine amidotransferase
MRNKKPVILICADPNNVSSALEMRAKIETAGGGVRMLSDYGQCMFGLQQQGDRVVPDLMQKISALVVMGNDKADIAPEYYNHRYTPGDPRRDGVHPATVSEMDFSENTRSRAQFEPLLVREALRRKIPLLGICGGMQRINIECGEEEREGSGKGTLIQHLPDHVGDDRHSQETLGFSARAATQEVIVRQGTKLAGMLAHGDTFHAADHSDSAPGTTIKVSTRHHQAAEHLAEGLIASACTQETHAATAAPLSLIKAIEADPKGKYRDQFIVGVQFHPELVREHHLGQTLAKRVVKEARAYGVKHRETSSGWRERTGQKITAPAVSR